MVSILPKDGVFRCVLDYQSPKFLCWRYSELYVPIKKRKQDRHFPAVEKLSYDNYLAAVIELKPAINTEFQFTLADGANCGTKGRSNKWTSLKIS